MRWSVPCLFAEVMLLLALPFEARATPWETLGPRAMGMGGAQVAIAQGPLAAYWNPAGLGQLYNSWGVEVPVSARGEFTGSVVQGANDLHQLANNCASGGPNCDTAHIQAALNNLGQPGNGVMLDAGVGVDVKIKKVALFVNDLGYLGSTPQIDTVNNTPATIANNTSKLTLRGANFTEIGLGYGQELGLSGLIVGANVKAIVGKVGFYQINLVPQDPGKGFSDDLHRNTKTSVRPGLDLGMLWDMRETFTGLPWRPRVGVVGRNINNPTFSQPDAALAAGDMGGFSLHGQSRAGVALSPFRFWHLAADIDLTQNVTYVDGFKSRFLSVGTEVNVFNRTWLNIPVRVGVQKNIANNSSLAYTGGFGFNFLHFMVDLAAMISAQSTTLQTINDNKSIPNNIAGSARIAFLFGGEDEGARNK